MKPEYESIVYHTPRHWFGKLELRKNGYYTLYDICNNEYRKDNHISHQLQDSLCQIVEEHLSEYDYKYDERLEVRLIEAKNSQVRTHIKALKMGLSFTITMTRERLYQQIPSHILQEQ